MNGKYLLHALDERRGGARWSSDSVVPEGQHGDRLAALGKH
jgi:hypothetical protein